MPADVQIEIDTIHRRAFLGGEPLVFHCHHYNTFLQQSIRDAVWLESEPFLVGAAAEVAYAQLTALFAEKELEVPARKTLAAQVYRTLGFGTLDLTDLSEAGGGISTPNSHYAMAWRAKWGKAEQPVCYFASGFLAGATAAIFDAPAGSYAVTHPTCSGVSDGEPCRFEVKRSPANYPVFQAVGRGELREQEPLPIPDTPVDYEGIFKALTGMNMVGDESGSISAFGVYLTRHYANYYNRISFEFLRQATQKLGDGALETAEPLLVEAGHVCAFNTFGGIMQSSEWDSLVRPTLKTREDWVHGIVAAVNALGWGRWQVTEVSKEKASFAIHDDYESVGYQAMYGQASHNVAYLAQGAATGIMDLVYLGDIANKPEMTPAFYDRLFKSAESYQGVATSVRAKGDAFTTFDVVQADVGRKVA